MPFAERFIQGFTAGQQAKQSKAELEKQQRLEANAAEDRDIEKQLLQHRLRELKIGEKIQAREAARQNFSFLEGQPESQLNTVAQPGQQPGPDDFTAMNAVGLPALMSRPKVTIPGIEELGIGDTSAQPRSMEEQLAAFMAQKQIEAQTKPWEANVAEGGTFVRGTGDSASTIIKGGDKLVPYVTRDKVGKQTTEYITEAERAKRGPATMERLPQRTSSTAANGEDISEIIEGIRRGDRPADTSGYRGVDRTKIDAGLLKSGFSITKAINDQKALQQHYANLNSDAFTALRVAADSTEQALTSLEELSNAWNDTVGGVFNGQRIKLAKNGGLGEEAKQLATDLEAAVGEVQTGLAQIKSGGTSTTNKALEAAEKSIAVDFAAGRTSQAIKSIRREAQHRIAAIKNLQPILPSETGGGGTGKPKTAAEVAAALDAGGRASDAATVKKVMASPEAMKALFP